MASPTERMNALAKHIAPDWSPERERLVRARLDHAIAARKRRQVVVTASAALIFIVVALVTWSRSVGPDRSPAAVASHAVPALPLLHYEDGSIVTAVSPDARTEPIEVGPELISTRLSAGAARFSVTPNPKRTFRVLSRNVSVTVLGTIFTVALEPSDVRVRVERGRVRVAWPAGERELTVGEEIVVPTGADVTGALAPTPPNVGAPATGTPQTISNPSAAEPVASAAAPEAAASASAPEAVASASAPEKPTPEGVPVPSPRHSVAAHATVSWRELAQDGEYGSAFAKMDGEGATAVRDEPGDLLLAADVARLGGHPEKAVTLLSRVVNAHAGDSRAPLAAFTLGRTLLDQLGRPREAAQAFATALKLDPHGALSQDALAREVESWSRAGEATLAHERATEYVERYPNGRRLAAVKRLGGLE
ncbi:MAG TPA: FecR domain-containing protein [Polyangiaceae bacterium]|nr:FecR domain-containing protein [Polyangiaceae bacterium]